MLRILYSIVIFFVHFYFLISKKSMFALDNVKKLFSVSKIIDRTLN